MVACPQCGTMNKDDAKNCSKCCINLYWAFQHYQELAAIRATNELSATPETPAFLLTTSQRVDQGPTAGWLARTIKKWGFKEAGKKVSTL